MYLLHVNTCLSVCLSVCPMMHPSDYITTRSFFKYVYISLPHTLALAHQVGGNSGNVLGVCRLVSSLAGGPMFWISGDISKRIGVNGVLTWSLTSYVLRFIIYASIKNPWQVKLKYLTWWNISPLCPHSAWTILR